MSYEKVKIVGSSQIVKKETGQIYNFLEVEVLQRQTIFMTDDAIKLTPLFDKLAGKEVLLPVTWGEYKGKPSLTFCDDCKPLPLPSAA
jgi:hypothetical protein